MTRHLTAVPSGVGKRDQRPAPPPEHRSSPSATHTLRLLGDLDRSTASLLEQEIEKLYADGVEEITLDLSELAFIDWVGATVIAFRSRWCRARGVELILVPGPRAVHRVFEQAGLVEQVTLEGDRVKGGVPRRSRVGARGGARAGPGSFHAG